MRVTKCFLILAGLAFLAESNCFGQQKPVPAGDLTKSTVVEKQTSKVVKSSAVVPADLSKTLRIEKPASTILARNSAGVAVSGKDFVNPKVQPGGVRWHPSFEAACAAARKSGKPVLLFQMMGKLDDQFC